MALTSRFSNRRIIPAHRVRQGGLGRPIFFVLLISTLLAALALFGAWMSNADRLASVEPNNARQPADAQAFDDSASPVRETSPAP
jgi:hypothetical protein